MKEPVPNKNGVCRWRGVVIPKKAIDAIKLAGYVWNETLEAYELLNPMKSEVIPLAPISFEIDHFHRAVHKPYGGDCIARDQR